MSETQSPQDKLAAMANQIADYFRSFPEGENAAGVAEHIVKFWAPKMRRQLIEASEAGAVALDPLAHRAVALLKAKTAG